MRVIMIVLSLLVPSGCVYNDYGAEPVHSVVPSVSGCPSSGDACSRGRS